MPTVDWRSSCDWMTRSEICASETNDKMELNSVLLEMLQCQVCWEPLTGRIYSCRFEHLLCQTCYPKLSHCPSCRERLKPNVRCLLMEQVANAVRVPCMYSNVGCPEQLQRKMMQDHEVTCDFRPDARVAQCPFVYSCSWLGSRAAVERHVNLGHPQDLVVVPDGTYRAVGSSITVLEFDSALLVIRVESVPVADFTSHYVHVGHVAQGSRAANARYSFKACLEPNGPLYKGHVTDYREPLQELAAAGSCLFFVSQVDEQDAFSYSICIKKLP